MKSATQVGALDLESYPPYFIVRADAPTSEQHWPELSLSFLFRIVLVCYLLLLLGCIICLTRVPFVVFFVCLFFSKDLRTHIQLINVVMQIACVGGRGKHISPGIVCLSGALLVPRELLSE